MFSLIRRISHSVIPRPDRPWEDDPTSNAPNTRRKRRLSSTEPVEDVDSEQARKKKLRGESTELDFSGEASSANGTAVVPSEDGDGSETVHREGSLEVKVVTEGVKEVELGDKDAVDAPETQQDNKQVVDGQGKDTVDGKVAAPESIPLPAEEVGELDEPRSTPPPQLQSQPDSVTTDPGLTEPSPAQSPKKLVVEDRGGKDSITSHPATPARVSNRKTRTSPKKVTSTKA